MKRIIVAAFLTAFASAAFAQPGVKHIGLYAIVEDGATPPAGYALVVPSYEWKDGRFVRNGDVYKSVHGGN